MSRFIRNRPGAGTAYIPRAGLADVLDDELTDFGDDGSGDLTSSDFTESGPSQSDILAVTPTYDTATGQDIDPSTGLAVAAPVGILASLGTGIASLFGGSNPLVNATGTTTESDESTSALPMLLLLAAVAGVLYMAMSDRS